jgi:hypothetical protein
MITQKPNSKNPFLLQSSQCLLLTKLNIRRAGKGKIFKGLSSISERRQKRGAFGAERQ